MLIDDIEYLQKPNSLQHNEIKKALKYRKVAFYAETGVGKLFLALNWAYNRHRMKPINKIIVITRTVLILTFKHKITKFSMFNLDKFEFVSYNDLSKEYK